MWVELADGVPSRVDRIKCLGNAVVPQVAYEVGKTILKIKHKIAGDHRCEDTD